MALDNILTENELALLHLAEGFREKMKAALATARVDAQRAEVYFEYLDRTYAAADELGIDIFDGRQLPESRGIILRDFQTYARYVNRYITRIHVRSDRRRSTYSVSLLIDEKLKIRRFNRQRGSSTRDYFGFVGRN